MRLFFCLLVLCLGSAHADQNDPFLGELFAELQNGAEDPDLVQADIESRWMTAPEIGLQVIVGRVVLAIEAEDSAVAGVLADHLVGLAPSFAEGWVLRGHVAAMVEDYAAAEIYYTRALALEPRQFHALSALGELAQMAGDQEDAFKYYRQALDVNPYLADVRERAEQLRFEMGSREI